MATYSTSEFRSGMKVMMDNDPCNILENEFVKPGKGQAFNRVKLRNLKTGRVLERTFKSGDTLPAADVVEVEMQYLYNDGDFWHFMDQNTYEQHAVSETLVSESKQWLKEQALCMVTLWNGAPLSVEAPNFVILKVTSTSPGVQGDTARGTATKPATLETGAVILVPLFVNLDDLVRVDTRTGKYASRAK